MTVRIANINDLLALSEMELAYAEETVRGAFDQAQALAYVVNEISKPNCRILTNDEHHGFTLMYIAKIRWYGPLIALLDHTYIKPEHRGLRTQNTYLDAAKKIAKSFGATKLATLWHPADEVERVDVAMQRKGWQREGMYYEIDLIGDI